MDSVTNFLTALSTLAWPIVIAVFLFRLSGPIRTLIESAKARKFTIKVAGNELSMEEASEQQRLIISDLQSKIAGLEKILRIEHKSILREGSSEWKFKRLLWVDDTPKNISYLVEYLSDAGLKVDVVSSTNEGVSQFNTYNYDVIVSDMGRPEGKKAGMDLLKEIRVIDESIPFYIFCSSESASKYGEEAKSQGANDITSSGTSLISWLTEKSS